MMKTYNELKAEIEAIHQLMVEAKKNKHVDILNEIMHICEEFSFNTKMQEG